MSPAQVALPPQVKEPEPFGAPFDAATQLTSPESIAPERAQSQVVPSFQGRRVFRAGSVPARDLDLGRDVGTAPSSVADDLASENLTQVMDEATESSPVPVPPRELNGWLEGFSGGECRGWVLDTQDPQSRVDVEAVWGGEVVATATADEYRTSLVSARIGDGSHGFVLTIPPNLPEPAAPGQVLVIRTAPDHVTIGTVRLPRRESLDALVEQARACEREGDLAGALACIEDVLSIDPSLVKALWIGARVAYNLKDQEKARILAERAAYLDPSNPRPAVILARIADNEGRAEDALRLWQTIPEGDTAYRESLIKSSRHLLAFGRHLDALQPALKALRLDPDEKTVLKVAAECYTALGAVTLALPMWRRFLEQAPGDKTGNARVKTLEGSAAAGGPAQDDPDFLANSSLRTWTGGSRGEIRERVELTAGVFAGPLAPGEAVAYQVRAPQEVRFDRLPHYGLRLETEGAGSELAFRMDPQAAERVGRGWRVSFEARSTVVTAPHMPLQWSFVSDLDDANAYRRIVWSGHSTPRARLLPFDLILSPEEGEMAAQGALYLVLTVEGAGGVMVHAPRKVQSLFVPSDAPAGGEDLVALRNLGLLGARAAANRPTGSVQEVPPIRLGYPFFDIVLWAPQPASLSEGVAAAVLRTVAPFAAFQVGLAREANGEGGDGVLPRFARDSRVQWEAVWDPHGSSAEWIAFVRCDAEVSGENWLTELYDFAATTHSSVVVYRSGATDCILVLKDDLLRWWGERENSVPGEAASSRISAFAKKMCL
ncbi:tetratricopeptide repeat protein [Aquabacter sp. L1I39]|uniref:tetratricopeptide repeat protein n=1 Tax=Aquabacter sp. L1I39 TaxID=2820278 RepID=UPI001AD9DB89|nr:tetratricopeptide repeat protein [Aquabacter sp. L1I39]QTL02260.1 tetratricopeptide repeat protein [Aquabacter sp. L1I39]